jgi:hypothetical protein
MKTPPDLDLALAHRFFSAECFNRAWDFIKIASRTAEEDEEMLRLSLASTWHWTQREDYGPTQLAVGYWQTAHIYTLLGQLENARRYGLLCLEVSQKEGAGPFAQGYAYEALARAEALAGNQELKEFYLGQGYRTAESIPDQEDRQQLIKDLETI